MDSRRVKSAESSTKAVVACGEPSRAVGNPGIPGCFILRGPLQLRQCGWILFFTGCGLLRAGLTTISGVTTPCAAQPGGRFSRKGASAARTSNTGLWQARHVAFLTIKNPLLPDRLRLSIMPGAPISARRSQCATKGWGKSNLH